MSDMIDPTGIIKSSNENLIKVFQFKKKFLMSQRHFDKFKTVF